MPVFPYAFPLPGAQAPVSAAYRTVFNSFDREYLPGGRFINGTKTRDIFNTPLTADIQAGTIMGKITSGGFYANWIVGQVTVLYDGSTSLTVSTAAATEVVRRIGSSGTFVVTGPPTSTGAVRQITVTYSAVDTSTGVITVTAVNASSTYTLTLAAGTDGGSFGVKVTNPAGVSQTIANQQWNVSAANLDTALEALTIVGASGVTVGLVGEVYTLTFASSLGDMLVEVVNDTTTDGGVSEGGIAVAQTVVGVDGRFRVGSVLSQADGSQTPVTFIPDGWPLDVTVNDGAATSIAQLEFPRLPVAGQVNTASILGYSVMDTTLKTWVKEKLSTLVGGKYVFSDTF